MKLVDSVKRQTGLYTLREAAKYAKMSHKTLRYWAVGNRDHPPLRQSAISRQDGKFLTFLEFQEIVAIRSFRVNYGATLPKIREAIVRAKEVYDIPYPFASRLHKTYLVGKDFHIILDADLDPTQLTGKEVGQKSMRPCIQEYMRDFQFDNKDIASAYTAYRYLSEDTGETIHINMNPAYCFGEPVVGNTGFRAQTLWRAAIAEGSVEKAAECYEVSLDSVIAAYRYCDEIGLAA